MAADRRALILTDDSATAALVSRALEPLETVVLGSQEWPTLLGTTTCRDAAVIVVDLSSSGDQRELVDALRECDVPIVALLASAADTVLARRADDFVLQPFDPDELTIRVQRLVRRAGASLTGPLRMYLAGSVRVQVGEKVVIDAHHTRRRAKALLVYLYLKRGRLVSKNQILADLWPDAEAADPGRVKHTVQVLRSTLEGARPAAGWSYILELDGACSFNIEAQRWTDLEEFESELASAAHFRALNQVDDTLEHYRRGLALRQEMFMTEFRYDDWAAPEIARLQELFLEALENAAQLESAQGAHDRAVDLLRRAVLEDPLREGSYMQLMQELWLGGRRVEALRMYQTLRETLARTLDVEPQVRATRLYEAIRRDEAIAV